MPNYQPSLLELLIPHLPPQKFKMDKQILPSYDIDFKPTQHLLIWTTTKIMH